MTLILKGHPLLERAKTEAKIFAETASSPPHLSIILVGDNPESLKYIKYKKEAAQEVGFKFTLHQYSASDSEATVIDHIASLSKDPSIHGILVQLPLPEGFNRQKVLDAVDPLKDIDGLTTINGGRQYAGHPFLVPCTPLGCMDFIRQWRPDLKGSHTLIINDSTLVGKPLSMLLLQAGSTVTIAHKHSKDLAAYIKDADILVSGIGIGHIINAEWVKKGACVIDVGTSTQNNITLGDVDADALMGIAGAVTPTPGGTGPATIAYLLKNIMKAYTAQNGGA